MTGAYISVPVPQWESFPDSVVRSIASVPVPQEGAVLHQEQAQAGASSLVQSISITDTALKALEKLEELPFDHKFKKYEKVCQDFYEYLDLCEQKNFRIKGYEVKEGKFKNILLDYDNRWGKKRRKELSYKLDRLESWFALQVDRPVTMVTFTSFHEGMNISDAWFDLNKSRTKILKLIRKYYPVFDWSKDEFDIDWFKNVGPDYFWVVEPHKSGYVHYHLAVFEDISNETKDSQGKGIEDKFRELWSKKYKTGNHTYGLDFSHKKGDDKLKSLKAYLSKYLRKGFLMDEWTIGMLIFNAHLWETGFRMYGASARISSVLKLPENKDPDIVWLETKYQDIEKTPEGELIETERVTWYRQYIPDWIDSPFIWALDREPDDTVKIYDWGRRYAGGMGGFHGYDPTHGVIKNPFLQRLEP